MVLKVAIDFSFIEENIIPLFEADEHNLSKIITHDAAKGVFNHAKRFQNTDKDLHNFWKEILQREAQEETKYLFKVLECIKYIKRNLTDFDEAFKELENYLPKNIDFTCNLYCIVGYDIGIISEGNAYLNLGHILFHENKRELLYFAMHEVHHVAYCQINPIYSFNNLEKAEDLSEIIKYSTHLEGLAVYSSLSRRKKENGFTHQDYITLNNPEKMKKMINKFYEIIDDLEIEPKRDLTDNDYCILEVMSGGDRLWYVVGAKMAENIDKSLGREKLNSTILQGHESFFRAFTRVAK